MRPPEKSDTLKCRVREDLEFDWVLEEGQLLPALCVRDPIRQSYFKLLWAESCILLCMQLSPDPEVVKQRCLICFGIDVTNDALLEVKTFAVSNQLVIADSAPIWGRLANQLSRSRKSYLMWLLHNYLFLRVPLFHPEVTLKRVLPCLGFLYQEWFWVCIGTMLSAGLYLAMQQWSAIVSALNDSLRIEAWEGYVVAIVLLKAFHEFGHALTTVKYGCRVPSVGIALMVGTPVLYTDTSDSWRLARRSERLAIVFAGVAAELIIAAVAILSWSFLSDGWARSLCFVFATTSLALSLSINLNPFMRYDGYYALSDYLRVPNLQARAFALMSWKMREMLFSLGDPPTEALPARLRRFMIGYAVATALYRLGLYIAIAAIVYYAFGKAIGIVLGAVEIAFFVALPIVREIKEWWSIRMKIRSGRRTRFTLGLALLAIVAFVAPWLSTIDVPGVRLSEREETIYVPFPAQLQTINFVDGTDVTKGDVLLAAVAPELQNGLKKASAEAVGLLTQIGRVAVSDKERDIKLILENRLAQVRETISAIERQVGQLTVRAPFSGRIVDVDPDLSPGMWLNGRQPLARLVSPQSSKVHGLVAETELDRIQPGARAIFVPDDFALPTRRITVSRISPSVDARIAEPLLADRHGGSIPVVDEKGELVTRQGFIPMEFGIVNEPTPQVVRGIVRVDGTAVSPAQLFWERLVRVLVREQGF